MATSASLRRTLRTIPIFRSLTPAELDAIEDRVVDKEYRQGAQGHSGNVSAAAAIGKIVAERARAAGIEQVSFDRSGFKYHGRVKALADAARENGLKF